MARCLLCMHPERRALDRAIVSGGTVRDIAERFSVGKSSVNRHVPHVQKLLNRDSVGRAATLLEHLTALRKEVEGVLNAVRDQDHDLTLKAVDRLAKLLELEFGTKAKVEQTTKHVEPKSREEELAEMAKLRADLDAYERTLKGEPH